MKLPIIQTKLRVPLVKDEYLRRAKLTQKLKKIPEYPLTLLHSGAGFGKSTALALFMRDEKISGCWYSISSMDDDILPFLSYIIHSIRKSTPKFGLELSAYMEEMDRYIREEELNLLASIFINEIVAIESDVILILDDFHQVEHSYTVNSWMEKILEHVPDNLHLVISSRRRPNWKVITKMKVCGQILEVSKEDLVLTLDEIELLLNEMYDVQLEVPQLQTIYRMTEGWIIALCMIAEQIPLKKDISELFTQSSHSLYDFFQYLVMEVFSKQPPMIQQFLEQTSILEEMEETICMEVTGLEGAAKLLEELKDRNLFIQKVGRNHYRYHALFREFLENLLQENHPETYLLLHEKSAHYYERQELWEKALYHYNKIKHFPAMAAILQENGYQLLQRGKLEHLTEQLSLIPEKEMDTYYLLWFLKAEVLRYRSYYQEAEDYCEKAFQGARGRSDFLGMSKALEGKARIYLDTIQPYQAERLLSEAITYRENCTGTEKESGKLYELLAENLLNAGNAKKAEKWLQKAKEITPSKLESNLEARLYLRTGQFEKAKKHLLLKKEGVMETSLTSLPQAHRETDLLLSLIEAFTGNGQRAKELAQAGIEQGIQTNSPFVEACGWIRMGHAVQILEQYDVGLAETCYRTALEMMESIQVARGKAEPLMGLCSLYGARGEFERAMEAGARALRETEKVHDVWLSGFITLCMGITCTLNDRGEQALDYFQQTLVLFQQCNDSYGNMLCQFWLAFSYYKGKQTTQFKESMGEFLHLVQISDYEFIFHKRSVFGPRDLQVFVPLLLECIKMEIKKSYAAKLIQDLGMAAFESHPGYSIRVQTLGQFKIWLGEKEVGEKEWQREKGKELFQLLFTVNGFISKEEILSILWPNQDKKSADRDFKVALNSLHHVLEPGRKARSSPFFVIREGTSYGLNPLAVIEVDTIRFQEWVQSGLGERDHKKIIQLLGKGLSLYQGEYLPERRYDDWCISKRESMLVYFLRGAEKMAQVLVRKELYDEAITWCEKIVENDRTWEEAYRLLMYCYYRRNNRPQAMKWYGKCVEVLEKELGVTPLEPTKQMYEMIVESENFIHSMEQP